MKTNRFHKYFAALCIALAAAVAMPLAALAAGTIAGTGINNTASVAFDIGGTPGTPIVSSVTFTVDLKVDFTVVEQDANPVSVAPGATNKYVQFLVTNLSNTTLDFGLVTGATGSALLSATTYTNNLTTALTLVASAGGAVGGPTFIDNLAPGGTNLVYAVSTIPGTELNGQIGAVYLTVVARSITGSGGSSTDLSESATYNGVNVLFADSANGFGLDASRDAKVSDRSAFRITQLSVAKEAAISDGFSGTKSIPGATITYTVKITNPAGGAAAANVVISDSLNAEIVGGHLAFKTPVVRPVGGACATADSAYSTDDGVSWTCHGAATWNGGTNTLTTPAATVNAGTSLWIVYQAVIQ